MPEILARRPSKLHQPYLGTAATAAASSSLPGPKEVLPQPASPLSEHKYKHQQEEEQPQQQPLAMAPRFAPAVAAEAGAAASPAPAMRFSLLATALCPPSAATDTGALAAGAINVDDALFDARGSVSGGGSRGSGGGNRASDVGSSSGDDVTSCGFADESTDDAAVSAPAVPITTHPQPFLEIGPPFLASDRPSPLVEMGSFDAGGDGAGNGAEGVSMRGTNQPPRSAVPVLDEALLDSIFLEAWGDIY